MANRPKKILDEILALPMRTLASLALSNIILLVIALFGGLSYLVMQAVLAVELLLMSLATIPLYPERGLGRHAFDMLKLTALLAFIYFLVFATYGIASNEGRGAALAIAWQSLDDADIHDLIVSLLYVTISIGFSLWQAKQAPDPKLAWARSRLLDGGVTILAMIFMSIVAVTLGTLIVSMLKHLDHPIDADTVLITLMVTTRLLFTLIGATMPESTAKSIADSPYVD